MGKVLNNKNVKNSGQIVQKERTIGQGIYGIYIFSFCLIYGMFFYYFYSNLDTIVEGLSSFQLTYDVKIFLAFSLLCIIIWFVLLTATIWRGRDIGFSKWLSIILYCIPSMPRFIVVMYSLKWLEPWAEIISSALWFVVAGVFLYLPAGWAYRKLEGKKV